MDETSHSAELSLFLASTAHDMKNSISVLSGTLERLLDDASPQRDAADRGPDYQQMAQMLYQTRRLNDSLMQLLALYKQVGTQHYPLDIQQLEIGHLVEQVVGLQRVLLHSRGIALELDVDTGLIWHLDEDLIIGVLAHAINNATHYTRDKVRLAIRAVDEYLEIRVEDNGVGFPQSMLEAGAAAARGRASGVNFLTNSAGLGLYFASEVAKMHRHRARHGELRLENGGAYGGGCFVLRLP
ncbi:sensor histidine kinase [Massilia horti]|uniref:histidine kinase n=1 Tax=Massilia horti TaxID=2562153 RepID=A0A4Y9SZ28_9BURK|nr:HAMP domain-containing sensor histidine kinase [Massilia horti]TFW30817.1 HAMP domain-containing histidine kinase [Massilia horti]